MPLPSIKTISDFWGTKERYVPYQPPKPSSPAPVSQTSPPPAPSPTGGEIIAHEQGPGSMVQLPDGTWVPPTDPRVAGGGVPPPAPSAPSQIPQDPFAYFSGAGQGHFAGQVAPGYDPSQLPRLRIPSLQTWARMGPQFQQQYFGFRQAQTGAIPEQSYWNIQRLAPPSGQRTLSYRR